VVAELLQTAPTKQAVVAVQVDIEQQQGYLFQPQ
jgi:hypothetical protein